MSPRALIFINRYFHPDHSATSQMLSDIAFALARDGSAVTVITSRLIYDDDTRRLPKHELVDGVRVVRVWTSRFGRANLAGRAIDYATFYIFAALAVARLASPRHTVIAKTDPPMLSVVAGPIARLRGARTINWLQDIFPEAATALGIGKSWPVRLALSMLARLRNRSLRKADMNVVLGERMNERLGALGVAEASRRIIPNWQDGRLVKPVSPGDNQLREQWGLTNAFVVAYSGNLGRAHDGETFLEAIAAIEQRRDGFADGASRPIVWLFIGGGAAFAWLKTEADARALKSVRFEPYQPREMLAHSLSVADVHLISLRPQLEGLIVPSKYYGVAAAGRPCIFIGDADGEIARTLARTDCGITIPQGDGRRLAQAVLELSGDAARCRRMGINARAGFEREFDLPIALAKWRTVLADTGM